ncbi:hypothetical protein [Streptomyces sp. NPDC002133]|uniref:hypothetical protein n=1 Tax=Streptomyces sp. NPDC002133 TaxID=3154409 RepID=UPI0033316320
MIVESHVHRNRRMEPGELHLTEVHCFSEGSPLPAASTFASAGRLGLLVQPIA